MVYLQLLIQKWLHLTFFCVRNHLDLQPLQPYHGADFSFTMSCNKVVFPKFSSVQFSLVSLRIIITHFFFFTMEKNHLWTKCKYFGSTLTRLLTPLLGSNQASSWLGQFDPLWGFCSLRTHPPPSLPHSLLERWVVTNHRNWATWPQSCTPPRCPSLPTPPPCWGQVCCTQAWAITQQIASLTRCSPILPLSVHFSFLFSSVNFNHSSCLRSISLYQVTDPSRKKAPIHLLS